MSKQVCIITGGSLASTPRMVKAADTLHAAGYQVRAVCTHHVDWVMPADMQILAQRGWRCRVVNWHRKQSRWLFYGSAVRQRLIRKWIRSRGFARVSLGALARGMFRVAPEVYRAALAEPADLYYGGTAGALAVVSLAAQRRGVPYGLDLEDFHSAEQDDGPEARFAHSLIEEIERRVLPGAAFLTAGSVPISRAYAAKYNIEKPSPLNNVFPLPAELPLFNETPANYLKLIWLSQTVAPNRGLEDAVLAMGRAGIPGELHVRGSPFPGYVDSLRSLAAQAAPALRVEHHRQDPARQPEELCRGYDVGLALEQAHVRNRDLCLCNKPFTYMIAGLAVAFTDTQGQRPLAEELGDAAILYRPGDVETLALGLKRWALDPPALARAKRASWEAACRRWNWGHAEESGRLLSEVARIVGDKRAAG